MARYRVFDGTNWCDACTSDVRIYDSNTSQWIKVQHGDRVFDGVDWLTVMCEIPTGDIVWTKGDDYPDRDYTSFHRLTVLYVEGGVNKTIILDQYNRVASIKPDFNTNVTVRRHGDNSLDVNVFHDNISKSFSITETGYTFTVKTSFTVHGIAYAYR
jgi:hypothetical protein